MEFPEPKSLIEFTKTIQNHLCVISSKNFQNKIITTTEPLNTLLNLIPNLTRTQKNKYNNSRVSY